MFNQKPPTDEFRSLVQERIQFDENTGSVNTDELKTCSHMLGSTPEYVLGWANGTARPSPTVEQHLLTVLRGLKNFK